MLGQGPKWVLGDGVEMDGGVSRYRRSGRATWTWGWGSSASAWSRLWRRGWAGGSHARGSWRRTGRVHPAADACRTASRTSAGTTWAAAARNVCPDTKYRSPSLGASPGGRTCRTWRRWNGHTWIPAVIEQQARDVCRQNQSTTIYEAISS